MWHSATASAVALLQEQHLLIGGLGGVIAVIVGGVVSILAARASRRTAVRPAANPQPAPASRRPAAPPVYGAPAPPTSPSRRLHPGPVSLGAPARPQRDDEHVSTSLFNPDIFGGAQDEPEETLAELGASAPSASSIPLSSIPLLRPASSITAEWRGQATHVLASELTPDLTHAPIWNRSPFAWSGASVDAPGAPEITSTPLTSAPPVWRSLGARVADAAPVSVDPQTPAPLAAFESFAPHTPIWQSRLPALDTATPATDGDAARAPETASDTSDASAPPIWSSYLRQE
jgi:hypothetical protein